MDLGTMWRNAEAHMYNSKAEFAADLNLIWDNCLTYNTNPVSLYNLCCVAPGNDRSHIESSTKRRGYIHVEGGRSTSGTVRG
jgi:hypothetical protein